MKAALGLIRGMAFVGVALSILALPLGAFLLRSALSSDIGDNEMGDAIALGLGAMLLILGGAGLILGGLLAILARRALAAPVEIRGSRRTVLIGGLTVAGAEVLISSVLAGAAGLSPSGSLSLFVGLSALFAVPFVVICATTGRRADRVLGGVLALAMIVLGLATLVTQAWLMAQPA